MNNLLFKTDIPGYMMNPEPSILFLLAKKYDYPGAIGIEIGSLHGRSSVALASGMPLGKLYCIDKWEGNSYRSPFFTDEQQKILQFPTKDELNTLEVFKENTKDFTNIETIQGISPTCVIDWTQDVDFVFLDASHRNPNDKDNIEFWLPRIKKGGMFIGHDYSKQFPDVIKNVKELEQKLGKAAIYFVKTSLWAFVI
jgi:predicted O-methyltransferase YrrM